MASGDPPLEFHEILVGPVLLTYKMCVDFFMVNVYS